MAAYAVGFAVRYAVGPRTTPLTGEYTGRAGACRHGWMTAANVEGSSGFVTLEGWVAITVVRAMEGVGCGWWSLTVR